MIDTVPTFAHVACRALAREESHGRRPRRLIEPDLATWRRFRGRMTAVDLLDLVLEDAAVTQPFAFDAVLLLGDRAAGLSDLGTARVAGWIAELAEADLSAPAEAYLADQARRLDLVTRLGRSDLPRGVRAHHRVLELPGTGGQLAHHVVESNPDVYLQDAFTIAWAGWPDRFLAGLVAVEHGLSGTAPVAAEAGLDGVRALGQRFDFVIGARPERELQLFDGATLGAWFPGARVVLV